MKIRLWALCFTALCLSLPASAWAQAPGVPVVRRGQGAVPEPELVEQAKKLRDGGQLLSLAEVKRQRGRTTCHLDLPPPQSQAFSGSELWKIARRAHLRVGYLYFCPTCKKLHLHLAGGYALTKDGAVASCYHVVIEPGHFSEGHLVAVTEAGQVLPVTQILACDKSTDVCILRVRSTTPLEALPLNTNITPGDDVWCYSDPAGHAGFFSHGIVNRFFQDWDSTAAKPKSPRRMNVSTDWAAGSSGSAVLDRSGNAVGHVSMISAQGLESSSQTTASTNHTGQTVIVFHDAVCAADVLALIKR